MTPRKLFRPKLISLFALTFGIEATPTLSVAQRINTGFCYHFAFALKRLHPSVKLVSCNCHAWVEANGLKYDSLNPKGTSNTLCGRCDLSAAKTMSQRNFVKRWANGNSGPISKAKLKVWILNE
jgi:hypothetical protein